MESLPLAGIAVAILFGMFAGTFRSIRLNLTRRMATDPNPIGVAVFGALQVLMLWAMTIALLVATPHPIALILLLMFAASLIFADYLQTQEESQSLSRWLRIGHQMHASMPALIRGVAEGSHSRVATRAHRFADRLQRGMPPVVAARQSRLPLTTAALAVMAMQPAAPGSIDHRSIHPPIAKNHLIAEQLTYAVVMVVVAWGISMMIRLPLTTLEREFELDTNTAKLLQPVAMVGHVVMGGVVAWGIAAMLVPILPVSVVRCVPWFGRHRINSLRCQILKVIGLGIDSKLPDTQMVRMAKDASRVRWIRKRCGAIESRLLQGASLPVALGQSGVIAKGEQGWLASAERNGNLGPSIERLVGDIHRHDSLRWRLRVAWLVPLVTVLVGGFVFAHAYVLFLMITSLIGRSA